jgi:hypothetical protein
VGFGLMEQIQKRLIPHKSKEWLKTKKERNESIKRNAIIVISFLYQATL